MRWQAWDRHAISISMLPNLRAHDSRIKGVEPVTRRVLAQACAKPYGILEGHGVAAMEGGDCLSPCAARNGVDGVGDIARRCIAGDAVGDDGATGSGPVCRGGCVVVALGDRNDLGGITCDRDEAERGGVVSMAAILSANFSARRR